MGVPATPSECFGVPCLRHLLRGPSLPDAGLTRLHPATAVRLEHKYEVFGPDGHLCCEASTTLACVDADGKIQPMPEWVTKT